MSNSILKSALASATLLSTLALAGCGSFFDTDYTHPDVSVPQGWIGTSDASGTSAKSADAVARADTSNWWHNFNDGALDRLVGMALATNNDLAVATIKVRQAQLAAGLAKSDLFPDLSAGADGSTERQLDQDHRITRSYGTNATIAYEVDLWGKLGDSYDAKKWEALATLQDRESTALTLTGTVANLYWKAVYYQQRLAIAQASIDYARKTLELVSVQYQSGASSSLEMYEARQSLESQLADYTQIAQSLRETKNALSILFDQPPADIKVTRTALPESGLPDIAAGLPAQLLERRPDIRASQLRLREDVAELNATRKSLLPTLDLTGKLGTSSDELRNILENPVGTLAASIALPFLNWNEGQLNIKVSQAQYDQDIATYRQSLYQAFSDVENALSARDHYIAQGNNLEAALDDARSAESIYETRFREGAVSMQDWLDAQQKRRTAEESLLENRLNRILNLITLYQALGGDAVIAPPTQAEMNGDVAPTTATNTARPVPASMTSETPAH
jgi:NodT family efflux transporter outer membrane factor (OMF) lipoprotein